MLKKLRWKFIRIAMGSLSVILSAILIGINYANYHVVTRAQDDTLRALAENEMRIPLPSSAQPQPFGWTPSPEAEFTTRFFVVHCDTQGHVLSALTSYIASVSYSDICDYAEAILSRQKSQGYYKDYRYYTYSSHNEIIQIYLNCHNELQFMRILLLVSVGIEFICLFLLFLVIYFFSGHAIAPFVKNMENQKQFITNASHELKTPLTSILTSADVLALDDDENEWIQNIQQQGEKMSKLVNHLVALSRLDEGVPCPERTSFSLSEVLWESVDPFSAMANVSGITFTSDIAENLNFYGDMLLIQQLLSILLDNALKYTQSGGWISLRAYAKRKHIVIEVCNSCDFIHPSHLERLFERFYRGENAHQKPGSGVGLSIAKAIVNAHHGEIHAKSKDGTSICFQIVFG